MVILKVKGEVFLLDSDKKISLKDREYIESLCRYFYDEENEWYDDLYDMSVYEIADKVVEEIEKETGIKLEFKAIDFEVCVDED